MTTGVALAPLGRLDETWLFRADARDAVPMRERLAGIDGAAAAVALGTSHLIVRTAARDAVDRERLLRALHARLGERPLVQLARPDTSARRLAAGERALALALRAHPWGDAEALAREARVGVRVAKERLARLAAERVVRLEATPLALPLAHLLLRTSPSSTAAARRAIEAVDGAVRAWLPSQGEASYADALVVGAPALDAARDVPGVAAVDLLSVREAWENAPLIDGLLRGAP